MPFLSPGLKSHSHREGTVGAARVGTYDLYRSREHKAAHIKGMRSGSKAACHDLFPGRNEVSECQEGRSLEIPEV